MARIQQDIILESSYFPPLGYIELIRNNPFYIDDSERFAKQSLRNRTYIMSANGRFALTVPLKSGKTQLLTNQVQIDNSVNWQANHLKTIRSAYGNAPFFEYFFDDIQLLISQKHDLLLSLNTSILNWILKKAKCDTNHITTPPTDQSDWIDAKDLFHPKPQKRNPLEIDLSITPYIQVFSDRFAFDPELSVIDKVFCEGRIR